jgi:uncharacterized protein
MQCFIYKSLKKEALYLYTTQKDDFSQLPDNCLSVLGRLEFVMALELTPERKLARENAQKVIKSLQEKGFFIQMPPIIIPAPASMN